MDLRRRLERLDRLPLRPATVAAILRDDPARSVHHLDPGWLLADPEDSPAAIVAGHSLWSARTPGQADALDRLWRYGVAWSFAAERIATEQRVENPRRIGRAASLALLGPWMLAAVSPDAFVDWSLLRDHAERRRWESDRLGIGLGLLARDFARRCHADRLVVEAAWLAEMPRTHADRTANDPSLLHLIREARIWAEATPWAFQRPIGPQPIREAQRRWLIAEVGRHCIGPFADSDALPTQSALAAEIARLRIERDALRSGRLAIEARLEQLTHSLPRSLHSDSSQSMRATDSDPLGRLDAGLTRWRREWDDLRREFEELATSYQDLAAEGDTAFDRRLHEGLAEFAAGAGHELNNPLAVILGRGQLLLARQPDPETARSLKAIIQQARRAHRILRDLIFVGRPPEPRPRPCQPSSIIRGALIDLQGEADSRGVELRGRFRERDALAYFDPDTLRHVADALIRNALEATPKGGTVRVETDEQAESLELVVADSGPGLSTRAAVHLFDPFYCGREAGRGLGLGLSRAATIIALAGGTIRWESRPDSGAVFHVHLPARRFDADERSPASRAG